MAPPPRALTFAERHAWQFFVALGLLYVFFGLSDLLIAVTFVSRQLALALLIIGLFGTVIGVTGLRRGDRLAWLAMWVYPAHAVADFLVLVTRPGGIEVASAVYSAALLVIAGLMLGLSYRRYLSPAAHH